MPFYAIYIRAKRKSNKSKIVQFETEELALNHIFTFPVFQKLTEHHILIRESLQSGFPFRTFVLGKEQYFIVSENPEWGILDFKERAITLDALILQKAKDDWFAMMRE